MQLEIGGGNRNLGAPWVNLDLCETADIKHDLNMLPWPLADESVSAVYSSHCIEHVASPIDFFREVARVCQVGARVEIRCPDSPGEMAMVAGHVSVVSINVFRHMDHVFPELFWGGCQRRLKLLRIEPGCDDYWFPMARANPLFAKWTDDEILTWLPRTRHENRFYLEVVRT